MPLATEDHELNAKRRAKQWKPMNKPECDLLDPTPELPDDMPINRVQFPARIHKVLASAGLKTIGEVRETSNEMLLKLDDLGSISVARLR